MSKIVFNGQSRASQDAMPIGDDLQMTKGHFNEDPRLQYCIQHSAKLHPLLEKLAKATMNHPKNYMLGATEVIQTCICLLKQHNAQKVLDVGLYTGYSALAWALALPDNGKVISLDFTQEYYDEIGKSIVQEAGQARKIDIRIAEALDTMNDLITRGESGTFDFVFLDADKREYPEYYEKCIQLLRPGGFIAIDNSTWLGRVPSADSIDPAMVALDKLHKTIVNDQRVNNVLLAIGDGLNLVFKK